MALEAIFESREGAFRAGTQASWAELEARLGSIDLAPHYLGMQHLGVHLALRVSRLLSSSGLQPCASGGLVLGPWGVILWSL